jgi:hypothetical protein
MTCLAHSSSIQEGVNRVICISEVQCLRGQGRPSQVLSLLVYVDVLTLVPFIFHRVIS